ncbi:hypothetical protein TNCV_1313611 [Trichonephila clavipes]|nr:hypothetical protein TNCV_1313611 [Trichonephila clavipes]
MAEIVNGAYGVGTVTANYVQIWFRRFRSVGFQKKLDVLEQHQLIPKNTMNRVSICEALAKRNEFDPFLKRRVTGD